MRFWANRRPPARLSSSSSVAVSSSSRLSAVMTAVPSCDERSSSCWAAVAACSRSWATRSRCSVALSSAPCLSSSSCASARVRSDNPSRLFARDSMDVTLPSTSPTRRSARSTVATAAGTSFSIRAASSARAFSEVKRSSAPAMRVTSSRLRSSSCVPRVVRSDRRLLRSSTMRLRASIWPIAWDR